MNIEQIEKLQEIISDAEQAVFFGGAGVSTESGIPDFRSVDGLYHLGITAREVVKEDFYYDKDYCCYLPVEEQDKSESDDIFLGWIADIYVLLQWIYNMPSAYISQKLSSVELARAYNSLRETSYQNACEKLYHKYLMQ